MGGDATAQGLASGVSGVAGALARGVPRGRRLGGGARRIECVRAVPGLLIDELGALERLKNAASARQARLAVAFDVAERRAQADAGVPVRRQGRGVAEQIALARRESPTRAATFLGHAKTLCRDLPATMGLHVAGEIGEYRAGLVAAEVALLDPAGRAQVDQELAATPATTGGLVGGSDRAVRAAAAAAAYRLDPSIVLRRGRHAESERYVSLRPAPDTMTILSAYLPVRQGVACYAALRQAAATARAAGDPRSQGQVMADALVGRVTGIEQAGQIPLELQLIMTDQALLADLFDATPATGATPDTGTTPGAGAAGATAQPATAGTATHRTATPTPGAPSPTAAAEPARAQDDREPEPDATRATQAVPDVPHVADVPDVTDVPDVPDDAPCFADPAGAAGVGGRASGTNRQGDKPAAEAARIAGYGPIPSELARAWLRDSIDAAGKVWIRHLFTDPATGQATAIDPRARYFPPALRRLLLARDQYCRTPFCGAPIRHLDHATDHSRHGPTDPTNGQGLCERCNQAKTAPGWSARAVPDPLGLGRHVVETTTPTGHTYRSTAPPLDPNPNRGIPEPHDHGSDADIPGVSRAG